MHRYLFGMILGALLAWMGFCIWMHNKSDAVGVGIVMAVVLGMIAIVENS